MLVGPLGDNGLLDALELFEGLMAAAFVGVGTCHSVEQATERAALMWQYFPLVDLHWSWTRTRARIQGLIQVS